jgi:hypothetical protein
MSVEQLNQNQSGSVRKSQDRAAITYEQAVGHGGEGIGGSYVSWAGCLPEEYAVVVVLSNRIVDDISGMALPLVEAASPD